MIAKKKVKMGDKQIKEFLDRQNKWLEDTKEKRTKLKEELEKEQQECTFKPKIDKKSIQLVTEKNKKKLHVIQRMTNDIEERKERKKNNNNMQNILAEKDKKVKKRLQDKKQEKNEDMKTRKKLNECKIKEIHYNEIQKEIEKFKKLQQNLQRKIGDNIKVADENFLYDIKSKIETLTKEKAKIEEEQKKINESYNKSIQKISKKVKRRLGTTKNTFAIK